MRIWHILFPESRGPQPRPNSSGVTYELAYEARVAIDALRLAIKQLDNELTPETRQSTALILLDALDRLARAERHFRIERVPVNGARPVAHELTAIKDLL